MTQADPLNMLSSPETPWSRSNLTEAMPGVPTPFTWTVRSKSENIGTRRAAIDLGAFPAGDAMGDPMAPDTGTVGIFFGRPAVNIATLLRIVSTMPGNSVSGAHQQLFGGSGPPPPGIVDTRRRYPVIAAKLPVKVGTLGRRLRAVEARTRAAWREMLPATGDEAAVRAALARISALYDDVIRVQVFVIFMGQGAYEGVAALARAAGHPGLEVQLSGGYGGMEETALAEGLWDVSAGRQSMAEFIAEFGHHGPSEGELSSTSWREDQGPLELTLRTIAKLAPEKHPRRLEEAQRRERVALETQLLADLPRSKRAGARVSFALARRFIPMRERGKSSMHRALDLARAYGRHAGQLLADRGALDDPSDVFFLTLDELLAPWQAGYHAEVAFRKERRAHYETLSVVTEWMGTPVPMALDHGDGDDGPELTGIGGSPGVAEGIARVVLDPGALEDPIEPGEILVCHTTDPSWVSLFMGADAMVVDIGSVMSHAAIVARELGVPCVLNVGNGTRRISDGDRLRVDGGTGVVTIMGA